MKKKLLLGFLCLIVLFNIKSFSQISQGGLPPSFFYNSTKVEIDRKVVYPQNLSSVFQEDAANQKEGVVYRYGIAIPVNSSIDNSGTWTTLPDGRNVWRLEIQSPGAKAIGLNFDKFWLPKGSKLFVYNESKDFVIGAFTSENNNWQDMVFATQLVKGETVVLEYMAPEYMTEGNINKRNATDKELINTSVKPIISISHICYAYRNVGFITGDEKDSSCEVNINCSEGTNWQNQKKGVARISVYQGGSYGWCSGSLVNNAAGDCTPYFLTADHCGGDATASEFNQWVFYFNYESSSCSGTTGPTTQTMTGATFKARGPFSGGSDFLLLQFNSAVPSSYNPFYNGWNKGTTASPSGVSIHHPAGLIKKISTYTTALQTVSYSGCAANSHWLVVWAQTTNGWGVTEGGSSGSPIFDNNKRIVGTLTGGSSYCSATTSPDSYGKFSQHWVSNGTASNRQLKAWLDPANTLTTLDGTSTCGAPGGLVCTNATTLSCGQTVSGTTVGGASNVTTYNCQTWSESGPEKVYKIVTTSAGNLTATLSNMTVDLDVFIVSSCSENACVASGDNAASYASAPAGTYYIVVDGYNGASGTFSLNVTCNGTTPSSCDTLSNVSSSETLTYYTLSGQWGYVPGHNGNAYSGYADKYTNSGTKYIKYAWVPVAKAYAGSGSSSVTFKAWNGSGSTPGAVLGSKAFTISTFTPSAWKLIEFTSPIAVTGNFFFGFELSYSSTDTFAVYTAAHRPGGTNTAYLYSGGSWSSFATTFSGNLNTSLGLEPVLCTTTDIDENATMDSKIQIFPNPANDMIVVDFEYFKSKIEKIEILDVIGQIKESIDLGNIINNQTVINLGNYNSGLYFISVKTKDKTIVNKFTVLK